MEEKPLKLMITGHRLAKLKNYNIKFIKEELYQQLALLYNFHNVIGFSGMASGVDLWFCEHCRELKIPYYACIPFDGQEKEMDSYEQAIRYKLIEGAAEIKKVRNSWMVEHCERAIVVWDGNKGGTHNVVQQLVEGKKGFYWINPVKECVWECL